MFELFWLATISSPPLCEVIQYVEGQQIDRGFKTFLALLHEVPTRPSPPMTEAEKKRYEPALQLYLQSLGGKETLRTAERIKQDNEKEANAHPEFVGLNFLVALADANKGEWGAFFSRFYAAYIQAPESYLAVRTEAILQIKLFERARTVEEKKQIRAEISRLADKASQLNPHDVSLYKMRIQFAEEEKKKKAVQQVIHEIVEKNIVIPRGDIPFYVAQAADQQQKEAAYQFLNKAREWYDRSQIIERAEQFIKDHEWKTES